MQDICNYKLVKHFFPDAKVQEKEPDKRKQQNNCIPLHSRYNSSSNSFQIFFASPMYM